MIRIKELLTEQKFEYGCVMLYYDFPEMFKIHSMISPQDIYTEEGDRTFGLEEEPHTTLLFGLHEGVSNEQVQSVLDEVTFGECKLHNISKFTNPKYDVIKFDVVGPGLHTVNSKLKQLPYTSNFPKYHPHSTVAYLKPETSNKYIETLKGQEFIVLLLHTYYTKRNAEQVKMSVGIENSE